MAGYHPLKITGFKTGLVQSREEFILPDDAYPTLQNAYIWRERILRKKGYSLLGRLQRQVVVAGNLIFDEINIFSLLSLEPTSSLVPGSVAITDVAQATVYTDPALDGVLVATGGVGTSGTINYATGRLTIAGGAGDALTGSVQYFPGLPVMGIRLRELTNSQNDQTVFFDQAYAYIFDQTIKSFKEFIPGTTWNKKASLVSATNFFWSTNFWSSSAVLPGTVIPFFNTEGRKLFWVTNNSGAFGALTDPIRISDGVDWVDFSPPNFGQIDATNFLLQCLSFLPYRGRMVAFNTWEGVDYAQGGQFSNRIRWSTIGSPFIPYAPSKGSWRDDIRGQGGFLDIPTSEDIVSVGFVRDNLVIYCERSTWQLRYTGRSIAPFQIEKVNSELGSESPFSGVQFDTSLVGIGDKGIVECDSYKSERIDIKIPDFVFQFQNENSGPYRVHGARDFINRLAFWTIPLASGYQSTLAQADKIFPNMRLMYNYENDSWSLFTDSLTTLGTYQPQASRTWISTKIPWVRCNFSWISSQPSGIPSIVGGTQQGFVEYLDMLTTNDASLYISAVTPNTTTPTVITSPNHNLNTGTVIGISGIPSGTPYASLNGGIFGITVIDAHNFELYTYDTTSREFSTPQLDVPAGDYVGSGLINIRENFSIVSKKFNFLDEGQNIQLGYIDMLMSSTEAGKPGAISLNIYLDYDGDLVSNTSPQNEINDYSTIKNPDTFFNSVIPTTQSTVSAIDGAKFWQRVYCPTRASFLTLKYCFSNAQLAGEEQTKDVQIDAQILWIRKGGRITQG